MAGVITAANETMIELFSGLSARQFAKLIRQLRREGTEPPLKGRPWKLGFADRVLLVTAYWRTNLTMRQIAALFGTSKSAADRIIDDLAPKLALQPRKRFARDTVLIVDGTLVPTRDHEVAAKSKNHRYSTNHQVVIDADTRLVVAVGAPLPGNRNDTKAFGESGIDHATRTATVIADGGYRGTRAVIPHRRKKKDEPLVEWKEAHNASHRHVRARVEHAFASMKVWKILPRLPSPRRRRRRGHGRHRPTPQPQPRRLTTRTLGHSLTQTSFGTSLSVGVVGADGQAVLGDLLVEPVKKLAKGPGSTPSRG